MRRTFTACLLRKKRPQTQPAKVRRKKLVFTCTKKRRASLSLEVGFARKATLNQRLFACRHSAALLSPEPASLPVSLCGNKHNARAPARTTTLLHQGQANNAFATELLILVRSSVLLVIEVGFVYKIAFNTRNRQKRGVRLLNIRLLNIPFASMVIDI